MKKYLIILPGFGETGKEKQYRELKADAIKKGYIVHVIDIQWNYNTLSQWIEQVEKYIKKNEITPKETTIFGFSFGAEIALLVSNKQNFLKVILASVSPYFSENLNHIPLESQKFFGIRRMNDFKNYSTLSISGLKKTKTIFLFGEDDWDIGIKTAKTIAKKNHADFLLISKTGHELTSEYVRIVKNKMR